MRSDGSIIVNPSRCVGCKICLNVCSFGHENEFNPSRARLRIYMEPFTGQVEAQILESCDLCGGTPSCVKWCPLGAIKYSKRRKGA